MYLERVQNARYSPHDMYHKTSNTFMLIAFYTCTRMQHTNSTPANRFPRRFLSDKEIASAETPPTVHIYYKQSRRHTHFCSPVTTSGTREIPAFSKAMIAPARSIPIITK